MRDTVEVGTVRVWSLPAGDCLTTAEVGLQCEPSIAFHPEKNLISCTTRPYTDDATTESVTLWELRDSTRLVKVGSLKETKEHLLGVAFHKDGRYLLTCERAGEVHFWNVTTKKRVHSLNHSPHAVDISLCADGKRLAVATDGEGTVTIWNLYPPVDD
jgi:WD40 repeat protein